MDEDVLYKALADPTRRLILHELAQRPNQTLFELCGRLAMNHHVTMSRQAVTKHLGILEAAQLVRSEFRGRYRVLTFDNRPIAHMAERWAKLR